MSWISDCILNAEDLLLVLSGLFLCPEYRTVFWTPALTKETFMFISFYVLNIGLYFEPPTLCSEHVHGLFLCPEYRTVFWTQTRNGSTRNESFYVLNIGLYFEHYPFFGLSQQRFWAIKLLTPRYCQDLIPDLGASNHKTHVNAGVYG